MWTFELSDGFKSSCKKATKEDILFDIATIIRFYLVAPTEEDPVPDIYIYYDGELDEIIKGESLLDENN